MDVLRYERSKYLMGIDLTKFTGSTLIGYNFPFQTNEKGLRYFFLQNLKMNHPKCIIMTDKTHSQMTSKAESISHKR